MITINMQSKTSYKDWDCGEKIKRGDLIGKIWE